MKFQKTFEATRNQLAADAKKFQIIYLKPTEWFPEHLTGNNGRTEDTSYFNLYHRNPAQENSEFTALQKSVACERASEEKRFTLQSDMLLTLRETEYSSRLDRCSKLRFWSSVPLMFILIDSGKAIAHA
ncbi:unnamed protein product [Rodentolepis nana]|uniref:Transposase n=1 Tax=Rodentolepis nana TaxID=102285 RepID=A0A0R3TZF5_RODNA|nr:unnamed protein product [Rodentolepis nana]